VGLKFFLVGLTANQKRSNEDQAAVVEICASERGTAAVLKPA
jgi:hypothetical protein